MEPEVEYICDIVQLCMLPALIDDIGTVQCHESHFQAYHTRLQNELPKLFDLWQQNHIILLKNTDSDHQIAKANIIILLCELTASQAIYKLNSGEKCLLENANKMFVMLERAYNNEIAGHIFNYYQQKLHKDNWKRQLGAVYGFERYLEFLYAKPAIREMPRNMVTFGLAVGLNVRECHEYSYKQIGMNIFKLILQHGMISDIKELNIHSVIFENTFNDTYDIEHLDGTINVWQCLRMCMDQIEDFDPFTWNQGDDSFHRLIQNVTMTSNPQMSIVLIEQITRLGCFFTLRRSEIENMLFDESLDIDICRDKCADMTAYSNFRWSKNILEMLTIESAKLLIHDAQICENLLCEMHRCYLVFIFIVPIQLLNIHLENFFSKFMTVLLECVVKNKNYPKVLMYVHRFAETFHLQLVKNKVMPPNLVKFIDAFSQVLRNLHN